MRLSLVALRTLTLLAICALWVSTGRGQDQDLPADSTEISASVDSVAFHESEVIAAQLRTVFSSLDAFNGVEVAVAAHVVRLSGTVADNKTVEEAEALANKIPGVLFVVNDLETDVQVETRVSPAIERIQSYTTGAVAYLPILGIAFVVLLLFILLARWAGRLDKPLERLGVPQMLRTLVGRIVSSIIFLVGLVLALDILDITALVGTVLGAAGVVGIAVGFAFQDIVENYFAGVLLSVRRPFSLNDHLKIGDVEGKVLRLTSRELLLMTLDGNHVRLPNATVYKATIYNYTRNPRRRFDFEVGVGTDEDLVAVSDIGLVTLNAIPGVMESPAPNMIVVALGDSNVVVRFFAWVDQDVADFGKVRSTAIRLVKTALEDTGISMPEPTYHVRMAHLEAPDEGPDTAVTERGQAAPEPSTSILEQANEADTTVDTEIDKQIKEDQARSDERNLLLE